jgi:hypothetical protein
MSVTLTKYQDPEECLCQNCPQMPMEIEQKCCKGKVNNWWQAQYAETGDY